MKTLQRTDEERIYQLTLELKEAKDNQKRATRIAREEVKRIQAEIDEILERQTTNTTTEGSTQPPTESE